MEDNAILSPIQWNKQCYVVFRSVGTAEFRQGVYALYKTPSFLSVPSGRLNRWRQNIWQTPITRHNQKFTRPDGTEKMGGRSLQGVNALPKFNRRYAAKCNLSLNGMDNAISSLTQWNKQCNAISVPEEPFEFRKSYLQPAHKTPNGFRSVGTLEFRQGVYAL